MKVFLGFAALCLAGCQGTPPQVSGIVALTKIEAVACQGRNKILKIRNNDTQDPQRVQGVLFEMGTNDDRFFKIENVTLNGVAKQAVNNLVEEIIIPPGGTMAVKVNYNPKETTEEDGYHVTYLDVVLNGPKLGVMQIEIQGTASTALEGCSREAGNGRVFEVISATTVIDDVDLAPDNPAVVDLDINTQVQGDFKFLIDGDKVILPVDGWPIITLVAPGVSDIPVTLAEDSPEGSIINGEMTIEGLTLLATGIPLSNVTLTTGTVTAEAEDISTGTLSETGVPLDSATGEMTLVLAIPLINPAFDSYPISQGGFSAVIELREKTGSAGN